jgi:U3 small nucleolar RNA-associated protein 21
MKIFRVIGNFTGNIPFSSQRTDLNDFITISNRYSWEKHDCNRFYPSLIGPYLPVPVWALETVSKFTFLSLGYEKLVYENVRKLTTLRRHVGPVFDLNVIDNILITVGADNIICAWRIGLWCNPISTLRVPSEISITNVCHPVTYLNKILVGSENGHLCLWNFMTGKLLFNYPKFKCGIRCISASSILDIVGIGLSNGKALIYNIQLNEIVMSFSHETTIEYGIDLNTKQDHLRTKPVSISSIKFSDDVQGSLLATGTTKGVIKIWNLKEKQRYIPQFIAHDGQLLGILFLNNSELLVSSGRDNSIRKWAIPGKASSVLILEVYKGHSLPPNVLRFYDHGKKVLSTGYDRELRSFSVRKNCQIKRVLASIPNLSQIVSLDISDSPEKDSKSLLTAHEKNESCHLWSLKDHKSSKNIFGSTHKTLSIGDHDPISVVSISSCGNYGLLGTFAGKLGRFSLESASHRGNYVLNHTSSHLTHKCIAHTAALSGISASPFNRSLVSVGRDGYMRVWNFQNFQNLHEMYMHSPINYLSNSSASSLVAFTLTDSVIFVYDVQTHRFVSYMNRHNATVNKLEISNDGFTLFSSSLDYTIRVWFIPEGSCVQVIGVNRLVTSFSLSPKMTLLATCHENDIGIYLWVRTLPMNRTIDSVNYWETKSSLIKKRTFYHQKTVFGRQKAYSPEFLTFFRDKKKLNLNGEVFGIEINNINQKCIDPNTSSNWNYISKKEGKFPRLICVHGTILRLLHFGLISGDYTFLTNLLCNSRSFELQILFHFLESFSRSLTRGRIRVGECLIHFFEMSLITGQNYENFHQILKICLKSCKTFTSSLALKRSITKLKNSLESNWWKMCFLLVAIKANIYKTT